jgi:hypothetical protein
VDQSARHVGGDQLTTFNATVGPTVAARQKQDFGFRQSGFFQISHGQDIPFDRRTGHMRKAGSMNNFFTLAAKNAWVG